MKQNQHTENLELEHQINNVTYLSNQSRFAVDRFKRNKMQSKFYTEFESYDMFKAVLSRTSCPFPGILGFEHKYPQTQEDKRGSLRSLTVEEEVFMVLTRLQYGSPIEGMAVRFKISTMNVSRILVINTQLSTLS